MPFVRFSGHLLIVLAALFLGVAAFLSPIETTRTRDAAADSLLEPTGVETAARPR